MVIDLKKLGIIFAVLVVLQTTLWFYFTSKIETQNAELIQKKETLLKLTTLEDKWSLKNQKDELQRVYEFLNAFGIKYTLDEKKKKKIITMNLKTKNVDKITSFIFNKKININKIIIKKIDQYTLELVVEVK